MSYTDGFGGWDTTIADAMGTLCFFFSYGVSDRLMCHRLWWLVDLYGWFEEAVDYTAMVDFTCPKTGDSVR